MFQQAVGTQAKQHVGLLAGGRIIDWKRRIRRLVLRVVGVVEKLKRTTLLGLHQMVAVVVVVVIVA